MWDLGEGNGNLLQYSCLENPVDGGAWWAAVHRVAQSWTRLKQLNMLACIGEINGNPLQYSCLENPRDRVAWWTVVCGVAQSQTWLKQLSSSSSSMWDLSSQTRGQTCIPSIGRRFLTTGPQGKSPFNQFCWAFLLAFLVCLSWSFRNMILYMLKFHWC